VRGAVVLKFLAVLNGVVSLTMLWPLGYALIDGTPDSGALSRAILLGLLFSAGLYLAGRRGRPEEMGPREALLCVTLSWILASAVGALPFWLSGALPHYTDAYFEAMSGFSTTGASVLTDIQATPRGLLFWRSLTHWLGGMGIIVLTLAVLPFLGVGGVELFKAEVPGPIAEKMTPRVRQTALILWGIYLLLSAVLTLLLLAGGMNLFESLTHMFGTMATGGFSPLNGSIGQYGSAYFDWVITIFMFLAGANFSLYYFALTGRADRLFKDPELRFYAGVVLLSIVAVTALLLAEGRYARTGEAIRYAAFQVVSVITTTGFVTADYEKWPYGAQFILLLLMFVGGCAGSTGGAVKNVRILVLLKRVGVEVRRILHPRGVIPVRLGGQALEPAFLYMSLFALASLLLCCLGMDPLSATGGVAATLGNVGPGLGTVGPMDNYASVPAAGKWILSACMLLGRLELFTVCVLLMPGTWRR
jgi:trk system potassium uptake protein TrkH